VTADRDIPAEISISPIAPSDIDAVRSLHKAAWVELAGASHSDQQNQAHLSLIDSDEYANALLSNNLLLARNGSAELLATAGWCPHDTGTAIARIRKVFVRPNTAGTGLGRHIVEAAEQIAKEAGFKSFFVRANANAEGFYARLGYTFIERGEMPAGGVALPVVFMEKRL